MGRTYDLAGCASWCFIHAEFQGASVEEVSAQDDVGHDPTATNLYLHAFFPRVGACGVSKRRDAEELCRLGTTKKLGLLS